MSYQNNKSADYFVDVAEGLHEGKTNTGIVMQNAAVVAGAFQDLWNGGAAEKVQATSAESLEIVSADVNDTLAGTGARKVIFFYLDTNFARQSVIVDLNGGTASLGITDYYRNDPLVNGAVATVIEGGSSKTNAGDITIQVTGGGAIRAKITADEGRSFDGHFTVPAGFVVYARQSTPFFPKNESGKVRGRVKLDGSSMWISTGNFPLYQNGFDIVITALVAFPEKADFKFQGNSDNPGPIEVNLVLELLVAEMLP